ncbi:RES superfamily protein [Arachidicoccus ginsenosidimutans]|uniref:RES family NAD+ phosphorylase n=1 Tax=Arachidicoccus sp. BS20 TaxID=1850526 RepID=UPI0007F119CB|nr:RES family NAD+ phosphorylase [Arachidicoccus sp. BS20]ANI88419.1 RES superfamily protein [Arachidicoccus sp. BS20]
MIVYRLAKSKYKNDLSGEGARFAGGRWNSKNVAMLYTSESRALCTTEIAVHTPVGILPTDYYMITIEIPDNISFKEIKIASLPDNWNEIPYGSATQEVGNKFIQENKYLVLKVPSAVVFGDFNFLINPHHKDFSRIRIKRMEEFSFDKRLFLK